MPSSPSPSLTIERLERLLSDISLGYGMKLGWEHLGERGFFVFVYAEDEPCNDTGTPISWKGRKWYVSKWAADSEVILTAFKAHITALEHEAREKFTFRGVRVLDPHVDILRVATMMQRGELQQDRRQEA